MNGLFIGKQFLRIGLVSSKDGLDKLLLQWCACKSPADSHISDVPWAKSAVKMQAQLCATSTQADV